MIEVQRLAAQVVGRVLAGGSLDRELAAARADAQLSVQERGAVQDIAYGTLRFLGEVDAALDQLLERPPKDDRVRDLLRVAVYQLLHTRAAHYAVVDHAVRTVSVVGVPAAKSLVNAVLRNFERRREAVMTTARGTDVGRYSHPQWWIDKLRAQYPDQYEEILTAANAHPPLTLRVNTRRTTIEAYLETLRAANIGATQAGSSAVRLTEPMPVERIPGFSEGEVSVQDAAAQLAAFFLDVPARSRVLDACAAPGGKTAHLAERSDAELVALDIDEPRLARVKSNLDRLALSADVICGDAAKTGTWWDGRPFDRVLADVPCSASGVVRRHPDIKWLRRPRDIAAFAERQATIVDALWQTLAAGGKLLYVTCSIFHEENQNHIARFLEQHPDAHRQPLPWPSNVKHAAGQILPDELHDGFFYALLQKA